MGTMEYKGVKKKMGAMKRFARAYVRDTWAIPLAVFVGGLLIARAVLFVVAPGVHLIPYLP